MVEFFSPEMGWSIGDFRRCSVDVRSRVMKEKQDVARKKATLVHANGGAAEVQTVVCRTSKTFRESGAMANGWSRSWTVHSIANVSAWRRNTPLSTVVFESFDLELLSLTGSILPLRLGRVMT